MRFVYNAQTHTKQKIKDAVTFPLILDMSPYCINESSPNVYKLTAVLLHRGASAYSGHFIARVWSPE